MNSCEHRNIFICLFLVYIGSLLIFLDIHFAFCFHVSLIGLRFFPPLSSWCMSLRQVAKMHFGFLSSGVMLVTVTTNKSNCSSGWVPTTNSNRVYWAMTLYVVMEAHNA